MKRVLVAMAIALMAHTAAAAIHYEFHQSTHSDIEHIGSTELGGRGVIDGNRSRVDFLAGNAYPPGTWVLATDGSRNLTFVDPAAKTYTEVNTAAIAAAVGSIKITVDNLKSNVEKLSDHQIYAGIPTEHYHLTITYDMTVTMRSIPVKQSVRAEIDKWTTVQFGDVVDSFFSSGGIRTSNADLDKLIEIETTKIKGFTLRQITKITTTAERASVEGSKLEFRPVRTVSREFVVTSVRDVAADAEAFAIPAAYKRADSQMKAPQTQVQILSLEPTVK